MSARVRPVACSIACDAPCDGGSVMRLLYLLSFLLIGVAELSTQKRPLRSRRGGLTGRSLGPTSVQENLKELSCSSVHRRRETTRTQ